jgi:hypothetical protein
MKPFLAIALLVLLAPTIFSQDLASRQLDGLLDKDYFDGFATGDVVYIYRTSGLPLREKAVEDLAKMLPVDRAALHGVPGGLNDALIDLMLGMQTTKSLASVAAENFGDSGFLWKVVYDIFPAQGGATGVWPRFVRYVKPDGSLVEPEKYLCSRKLVSEGSELFSVMSFNDLSIVSDGPEVDGEEALLIARKSIDKLSAIASQQNIELRIRFHDQRLLEIPVKAENSGEINYRSMWQVRFMLANPVSYELFDNDPIVVWVTSDGFASTLSIGGWHAKSRRTKQ